MLASLLPGLRDLRVPLATGFLWLVVLWLVFYQSIPAEDAASGLPREVYRLLGAFGPAALVTVITFVAYIVGILLSRPGIALVRTFIRLVSSTTRTRPLSASSRIEARQLADKTARRMLEARVDLGQSIDDEDLDLFRQQEIAGLPWHEYSPEDYSNLSTTRNAVETVSRQLQRRMDQEVPLVATRLLAENRDLFDRYDRADAEAAFRLSVALPIVGIAILIPLRLGAPWWGYLICIGLGLVISALLVLDGWRKQMESNDAIFQAVFINKVEFPSIETALAAVKEQQMLLQETPSSGQAKR